VTDVLSQRGLNRATLARQDPLEHAPARAIEAIEHLGGMQSQAPLAPYAGLWTRLQTSRKGVCGVSLPHAIGDPAMTGTTTPT
jgi:hypothetical protein